MRIILLPLLLSIFLLGDDFVDLDIGFNIKNKHYEDSMFYITVSKDDEGKNVYNNDNVKNLNKDERYINVYLDANFNKLYGVKYSKNSDFDKKGLYFGNKKFKWFEYYNKSDYSIDYKTQEDRKLNKNESGYTLFSVLDIKDISIDTTKNEDVFDPTAYKNLGNYSVSRKIKLNIVSLTTEHLYDIAKEDSMENQDYFNGFIFSKVNKNFRFYGTGIISLDRYVYKKGEADYFDGNNTISIGNNEDPEMKKMVITDARFRGYGYGYKVTAEFYRKNFSLFLTSYYKKMVLENFSSKSTNGYKDNTASNDKLKILDKYITFGINYRF